MTIRETIRCVDGVIRELKFEYPTKVVKGYRGLYSLPDREAAEKIRLEFKTKPTHD